MDKSKEGSKNKEGASQVAQTEKVSTYNAGDPGSILVSGRSPGEGIGNPFQRYCLENSMGRGGWWATVHGVAKSQILYF